MKVLVLGGGSIKGAWQAGAIKALLNTGYKPKHITGISVGSMNGVFMVDAYGRKQQNVGQLLWDFWADNIYKPESIAIKRNKLALVWQILTGNFKGFADTTPLRNLLRSNIHMGAVRISDVGLSVGTVNIASGKIIYADRDYATFLKYVMASTAIPFAMPAEMIGRRPFLDGGLRDSAPLKIAIQEGATDIVCIANHPEEMGGVSINPGNILQLGDRISDIISNNNLNNDIIEARRINRICPSDREPKKEKPYKGKRKVKITVIRPEAPIEVKLDDFNIDDIIMMLNSGYETARKILR